MFVCRARGHQVDAVRSPPPHPTAPHQPHCSPQSWPDRWDISCAGHISAGERPLPTAQRELQEELGLSFPPERFDKLFVHLEKLCSIQKGQPFVNNEFNHVFLIRLTEEEAANLQPGSCAFTLQTSEVSAVTWLPWRQVQAMYESGDPSIVPSR